MASTIIGLFKGKKKAPEAAKPEQKGPILTPLMNDAAMTIRRRLGRGGGVSQGAAPLSDKLGA